MAKTQEEITRNMRSNKSKDTKPELLLRNELWKRGLRYRKNYKKLGKCIESRPDIELFKSFNNTIYGLPMEVNSSITVFSASRYSLLGISPIEPSVVTTIPIVE